MAHQVRSVVIALVACCALLYVLEHFQHPTASAGEERVYAYIVYPNGQTIALTRPAGYIHIPPHSWAYSRTYIIEIVPPPTEISGVGPSDQLPLPNREQEIMIREKGGEYRLLGEYKLTPFEPVFHPR